MRLGGQPVAPGVTGGHSQILVKFSIFLVKNWFNARGTTVITLRQKPHSLFIILSAIFKSSTVHHKLCTFKSYPTVIHEVHILAVDLMCMRMEELNLLLDTLVLVQTC